LKGSHASGQNTTNSSYAKLKRTTVREAVVIPSVNVYQNKERGTYLVQELMPSPLGGSVECGDPIVVDENAFDSVIAGLVFRALANYAQSGHNSSRERRFGNEKEALAFAKQHLVVNVAKIPGNRIRVVALQRRGGGHVGGVPRGETVLDEDSARQDLARLIREAFSRAR
jgi:hypothetical protein